MIVSFDLSLTPAQKMALHDAMAKIEQYLTSGKMKKVIRYWSELSEEQRQQIKDAAPVFARLVKAAELFTTRLER